MKLYFENSKGEERFVADVNNEAEVYEKITEFLKQFPHFKHYYTRVWWTNDRTYFDVGSHTEFFFVDSKIKIVGKLT